ncbi:MAG: zinc ABC transporter substrate-binding protein [Pseudomonadota bacterium]|nr:zinc ABC transporter substrate-binding protein [Pseudomonadota bacterium]
MRRLRIYATAFFLLGVCTNEIRAEGLRVVVTIPPVHSLASMVMKGVGTPHLLVKGTESPHDFAMRPSHVRLLTSADIIIRVAQNLEGFLEKPLRTLPASIEVIELIKLPGMKLFKIRRNLHHDHGDAHDHESPAAHRSPPDTLGHTDVIDPHLWLDTDNASKIVTRIADILSRKDPKNASLYAENAAGSVRRLAQLKKEVETILNPIKTRAFLVFHHAYQYYLREFDLRMGAALILSSEIRPGARRLAEIRTLIRDNAANCVFAEPQFSQGLVRTVVRGTTAKVGILDPLGSELPRGAEQYPSLIKNLAQNLASCLR